MGHVQHRANVARVVFLDQVKQSDSASNEAAIVVLDADRDPVAVQGRKQCVEMARSIGAMMRMSGMPLSPQAAMIASSAVLAILKIFSPLAPNTRVASANPAAAFSGVT
jgi:hypothetical protein